MVVENGRLRGRVLQIPTEGLTLFTPEGCKRVKIGYYPEWRKNLLYLGFRTRKEADHCRRWLIQRGLTTKYNYDTDSGCINPRPAKRISSADCAWELKIHRPSLELIQLVIKKDRERSPHA